MDVKIEESWKELLQSEFEQPYFEELTRFVREAYRKGTVYPPAKLIFQAFDRCPFDRVKVVIVGQDPYHQPGQ
ncbi:MAG TPA: uracil-DNA glycosylase, partial [Proteiniphilum sp.]|nr:uracil-DNA glycosylase [Proteiniphilum sp.]